MKGVKKGFLLLLLLAVTNISAFSQAAVAKLKFEEAEEAYASGDYATALEKLDETEKMLGQTNPRILYLRITAQHKVMKTQTYVDLPSVGMLKKQCRDYLVKYENVDGIEEKYKEIYKISEALKYFNTEDQLFTLLESGGGTAADLLKAGEAYDLVYNGPKAVEYYSRAAAKGSANGMYFLSLCYANAFGVKKDTVRAEEWLNKAADAGAPGAWYTKAIYSKNGTRGYTKSDSKRKEYLGKALALAKPEAEKGNAYYMYELGRALLQSGGDDTLRGVEWLLKGADKGNTDALDYVSSLYRYGDYVSKDFNRGFKLLQKAAEKGSAVCMYSIAMCYYRGETGTADMQKAMDWFVKASDYGSPYGASMVGLLYGDGKGVTADQQTAVKWYQLATDRNSANAPNNIGNIYYWGNGNVGKDWSKSVQYYAIAAERGNTAAMNNAGNVYFKGGNGVTQDYKKAAQYYEKGIKAGYHWCMYNYGNMLYQGNGMAVDYAGAAEYYKKAAELGNTDAMEKLYEMYTNGTGVKKDKKLAQDYYEMSLAAKAAQ